MSVCGLYVFEHELKLGNAPAHKVLETVGASLQEDKELPRSFGDYNVTAPSDASQPLPGVTCHRLV